MKQFKVDLNIFMSEPIDKVFTTLFVLAKDEEQATSLARDKLKSKGMLDKSWAWSGYETAENIELNEEGLSFERDFHFY